MKSTPNGYDTGYTFLPKMVRPRKIASPQQDNLPKNKLLNTQQAADYLGLKKRVTETLLLTQQEGEQ